MSHPSRTRLLTSALLACALALAPLVAQPAKGKKYALLVGVDYYAHSGFKPLDGAENDVVELEKVLKKQGFTTRLLTTARGRNKGADSPTAANLRRELDALLADKTREDTVLIALAGHGAEVKVPHPDDTGKEEPRTRTYTYFIPTDGNLQKISYSTGQSDRLIELGELFDRLGTGPKKCGAGAKLVLIDACRNGVTAESSTRAGTLSPTHVKVPDGVSALFSCGPGQFALELSFDVGEAEPRKHGVFFWHVIQGLKGKAVNRGKVNWSDLTSYVQDEVPAFLKRLDLKSRQNPHAVLNATLPVVLVEAVVEGGKKGSAAKEKIVVADGKAVVSSIGMRLVPIPAGTFTMGSPAGEKGRGEDEKQHEVEITRDFHLGEKEVTQKQFKEVMGYNPSFFSKDGEPGPGLKYGESLKPAGGKDEVKHVGSTDDFPVENVSWEEAMAFCRKLTEKDRKEGRIGRALKYRLPTEAEWEYACRGGARSYQTFHFGNALTSAQANFNGNHPYGGAAKGKNLERTCKVGSYEKNAFGLYDMHGNVFEWCQDWYDKDYYASSPRRDLAGARSMCSAAAAGTSPARGAGRRAAGGSRRGGAGTGLAGSASPWFSPGSKAG